MLEEAFHIGAFNIRQYPDNTLAIQAGVSRAVGKMLIRRLEVHIVRICPNRQ